MRIVASLLGAVGIAAAIGFTVGTSIPVEPLDSGFDPLAAIPHHEIQSLSREEAARRTPTRDQFPLETADGVIPVGMLAVHGRNASRMREQPLYGATIGEEALGLTARYATAQAAPAQAQGIHAADGPAINPAPLDNAPIRTDQPDKFVTLEPGIFADDTRQSRASVRVEVSSGYSDEG